MRGERRSATERIIAARNEAEALLLNTFRKLPAMRLKSLLDVLKYSAFGRRSIAEGLMTALGSGANPT